MKRSEINAVIKKFEALLAEYKFALPPYLFWLVSPCSTGYMHENNIIEIDTLPTAVDTVGIDLIHTTHPNALLTQIQNMRKIDTTRR